MTDIPVPAIPKLNKIPPLIAIVAIGLMAGAYLLFLYSTWNQYQDDRAERDQKIDLLLEKISEVISKRDEPLIKLTEPEAPDGV
jgi:hypothetical protein